MKETIYDLPALARSAMRLDDVAARRRAAAGLDAATTPRRIGMVCNPTSHRNRLAQGKFPPREGVLVTAPGTRAELQHTLAEFAHAGVDLLVVDGGDGTVRDVLTCAGNVWDGHWPRLAVLPSGKTNALALDLGIPAGWTFEDAVAAAEHGKVARRTPIEVARRDAEGMTVRGFLFGAGAFVRATALAQQTHRAGAFRGVAVGLALAWGVAQTVAGSAESEWRRGDPMRIAYHPGAKAMHGRLPDEDGERYLLFASTLNRLPIGLKPLGRLRSGLKTLVIDAPPRQLALNAPFLLAGSEARWLEARGYHRADTSGLDVLLASPFILDGEIFPGGDYRIEQAAPLSFVVP